MRRSLVDWWTEERAALARGFRVVAGVDEAGRGPLAGPVVAAAVVLPFELSLEGVRDSKQMSPEQREAAFELIQERALAVGVGIVDAETIDRVNILRATHHAMRDAVASLPLRPDHALIDGLPVHPFPVLQTALVQGDRRSASIAASSIVAKVTRDRIMERFDHEYPGYGFGLHKGYPTPEHLSHLEKLGPCAIHRRSFAPVARLLSPDGVGTGQTSLSFTDGSSRDVGAAGEAIAAAHLRRLGWSVLCERYRCREGEIDVIARDGPTVSFVEVKTVRGRAALPAEAVTLTKRSRLAAAARAWVAEQGEECACRFDVALVRMQPDGRATVELLIGAFQAGE